MKEVERVFRLIVTNLSNQNADRLRAPIEVAEIYQSLIPYRHFRQVLGFDTNEDYEMALLRFFAGEGGFATMDPTEAQEALLEEARSVNPHPGAFREYAAAKVYLNVRAVENLATPNDAYAPPRQAGKGETAPEGHVGTPQQAPSASPSAAHAPQRPFVARPPTPSDGLGGPPAQGATTQPMRMRPTIGAATFEQATTAGSGPPVPEPPSARGSGATSATCRACSGVLPADRKVSFCPYCGANVKPARCPACGAELETDWRFCITCGRPRSPGG